MHIEQRVPDKDERRHAFYNAIFIGEEDGRFRFEDLAKEFANERVRVDFPIPDPLPGEKPCYGAPLNKYARGAGFYLHELIVKKGFIPLRCSPSVNLTPLMLAKLRGQEEMIKTLLANGANPKNKEVITYYRKGKVLGAPKEKLMVPWTYMDFSFDDTIQTQKGGRRRRTGRARRRKQQTRRVRRS